MLSNCCDYQIELDYVQKTILKVRLCIINVSIHTKEVVQLLAGMSLRIRDLPKKLNLKK
jgi:hypothetical protein